MFTTPQVVLIIFLLIGMIIKLIAKTGEKIGDPPALMMGYVGIILHYVIMYGILIWGGFFK